MRGQENANAPSYRTFGGMLQCLTNGVREYATVLHAAAGAPPPPRVAPAGKAFSLIHAAGDSSPVHFGRLYVADESHPDFAGSYLAACVFVAVLAGVSPVGLPVPDRSTAQGAKVCDRAEAWANKLANRIFAGRGGAALDGEAVGSVVCTLTEEEAGYLQRVAHVAVFGTTAKL